MSKQMKGVARGVPWLVCALLVLSAQAQASVLVPIDAGELMDQSELIFTGVAVDRQVATSRDGRYPFTFYTFAIEQVVKGEVAGEQITLRFEGGEIGDEYLDVIGVPTFERGARYLLFVADNGQAISPVVGWGQGRFELLEHPSRPGEHVVVDRHGMAIEGIGGDRFLRTRIERDGRSVRRAETGTTGIEVLAEDGVTITDPLAPELAKAHLELAPAGIVLDGLRAALAKRVAHKSFRPGALVRSLTTFDVPDQFSLRPSVARQ